MDSVSRKSRFSGAYRKWHISKDHAASTLSQMESYFMEDQMTDVVVIAGDRRIRAHKLVLSAGSEYFANMFADDLEPSMIETELYNIDGDAVWSLLNYLYTGKIELVEDTVETLLETSCSLLVGDVFQACSEFIKNRHNPSDCTDVSDVADSKDSSEHVELSQKLTNEYFVELKVDDAEDSPQCGVMDEASDPKTKPRKTPGNVLYVFGGGKDCVEKYDAENDKWAVDDEFKLKVPLGSRVVEADGKLYIVGGEEEGVHLNTAQCYDIERKTVRDLPPMGSPRSFFKAAILGGSLYAVGGRNSSGDLNTVERLDLKSETWSYVAPMSMNKWGAGVVVLNGKLYVVGGYDEDVLPTVECYDPDTDQWMPCASMTTPRLLVGVGVLNGFLYAVGCLNLECDNSNTVERYDPKTDTWTKVASMNYDRWGVEVCVLGEKLFAVGGAATHLRNEVEVYDPVKDEWQEVAPLNVGRASPCVMVMKL